MAYSAIAVANAFIEKANESFNFDLKRMEHKTEDECIAVPDSLTSLDHFTDWLKIAHKQ